MIASAAETVAVGRFTIAGVCGLALIAGWQTRIAAFLLAGFTLLAAIIFHTDFANQVQYLFFMKNLAIAGGLLALVAHGPGPLALDTRGK